MVTRLGGFALAASLSLAGSGCLMAGNYHSARTLEKGTSSLGMTASMTTYEWTDENDPATVADDEVDRIALPNLIPEITYHVGITDDVEAGGRLALGSLGMEADVKWRFVRNDKLHLAVAPAVGYQAFAILQGSTFRLPAILTYDLSDNFSFNAAAFFSTTKFAAVDEDDAKFGPFSGTLGAVGAAVGFDLRGETFVIRPAVEFTDYEFDWSDGDHKRFSTVNVLVHWSMILGREKKQLNRMERKMDRIIDNTEGRSHSGEAPVTDDSEYPSEPIK